MLLGTDENMYMQTFIRIKPCFRRVQGKFKRGPVL